VVDEAVDFGCGDDVVVADFAPASELVVGRDDQRGPFVAEDERVAGQYGGRPGPIPEGPR
jgi:hypothetical protein